MRFGLSSNWRDTLLAFISIRHFSPSHWVMLPEVCASENIAGPCQQVPHTSPPPRPKKPPQPSAPPPPCFRLPAQPEWGRVAERQRRQRGPAPSPATLENATREVLASPVVGMTGVTPGAPGVGKHTWPKTNFHNSARCANRRPQKYPEKVWPCRNNMTASDKLLSECRGLRRRREADQSRVDPSLEDRTREGLLHNSEHARLIGLDRADPSRLVVCVELVQPYHIAGKNESFMWKTYFLLVFFTFF